MILLQRAARLSVAGRVARLAAASVPVARFGYPPDIVNPIIYIGDLRG
jgi:hypothetical protein